MKNTMFNNIEALKEEARFLIGASAKYGDNTEYSRGVIEIIASFISYDDDNCHTDNCIDLAKELGFEKSIIDKMW